MYDTNIAILENLVFSCLWKGVSVKCQEMKLRHIISSGHLSVYFMVVILEGHALFTMRTYGVIRNLDSLKAFG